jgi:hypothetical protein
MVNLYEQHILILKNAKELFSVCLDEDKEYLNKIIINSSSIVKEYNVSNFTCVDISASEIGRYNSTIKKVILGKYFKRDYIGNSVISWSRQFAKLSDQQEELKKIVYQAILKTSFDKTLMNRYTIFRRSIKNYCQLNELEIQITELFKSEILETFESQNEKLINQITNQNEKL